MTDTSATAKPNHVSKGSLSFSVLKPKTIDFAKYEKGAYKLGVLVGRATGHFTKIDQRNDTPHTGLKGAFKMILGNDAGPNSPNSVSSGVLYMPEGWLQPIISALDAAGEGAVVQFVYEVRITRRGDQDYAWEVVDLQPAKASDPLADLISSSLSAPAIADQSGDKSKSKAA